MERRGSAEDVSHNPRREDLQDKASISPRSSFESRLTGRDSLVSLQSYSGSSHSVCLSEGHEPSQDVSPRVSRDLGHSQVDGLSNSSSDTLVGNEGAESSLLESAAPIGRSSFHAAHAPQPLFDVTSFSGPIGFQDEEFIKCLKEKDSGEEPTKDPGEGVNQRATFTGKELGTANPAAKRGFPRSLTLRKMSTTRRPSIQDLGRSETDERGEVTEVILEGPEKPGVDISSMVGPTSWGLDPSRRAPLPRQETFFPQANWKPWSMKRPFLLSLIFLSLGLAVLQELFYQKSSEKPLLQFRKPSDIPVLAYIALKFVPTIAAVTYGVLWQITDFEVKRLEAFFQMSKEGGALAAESINVDYITMFNAARPFRALQRRHYAVAMSAIASLLATSLVPTLVTASIIWSPDRATRIQNPGIEKWVTVDPVMSRLLSATYVVIAVLGSILFYQLQTRRSGLLADVKGIAGLAAMAVQSHIMMDFEDMDVAKPKDIHAKLRNQRYVLRNSSLAPDDSHPVSTRESDRYKESHLPENPHPLMLRAEGGIPFIMAILAFFVFIPLLLFSHAGVVTDKAPWAVTAMAVIIKMAWGSLETSIRMLEPYWILSKRHAPAKTLTLDYTAMPFGWAAAAALWNGHWMVFLVGLGTILAEILTVFVTSLANVGEVFLYKLEDSENFVTDGDLDAGPETVVSIVVTLTFTMAILLYLFVVALVVFVRRRRPFLPRQPNTIASVLAFMHQSQMLYDFVGTAKYTQTQLARHLDDVGRTYGLGWFEGRDGRTHCGVDQEELIGSYKHGVDYSQRNEPWNRDWQVY